MKIQNLSIVVPNKKCVNHCASCPSRMHDNTYRMNYDMSRPDFDVYYQDYLDRLEFARDNGCNTVMLTGTSEPQQNRQFLQQFGVMLRSMKNPFKCVEMQTTGVLLDANYMDFLRRHVRLSTIAFSMFSVSNVENARIINTPKKAPSLNVCDLSQYANAIGMNVRICLNLTNHFDKYAKDIPALFGVLKEAFYANQVTFRVLYESGSDCPEDIWVRKNRAADETVKAFRDYIKEHGSVLGKLSYGATKYSVHGMSVVLDDDSMGKESDDADSYKYLILRPDCKLYSSWDDPASLIF